MPYANKEKAKAYAAQWYQINKEECRLYNIEYRKTHKEELRILDKKKRENNKEQYQIIARKKHLRDKYNLTLTQYNDMVITQEGKCAICTKVPDKPLYIDHNHETDTVRELLCQPCNSALGLFCENLETLENAKQYLIKHSSKFGAV